MALGQTNIKELSNSMTETQIFTHGITNVMVSKTWEKNEPLHRNLSLNVFKFMDLQNVIIMKNRPSKGELGRRFRNGHGESCSHNVVVH